MLVTKQLMVPIDFHSMEKHTMEIIETVIDFPMAFFNLSKIKPVVNISWWYFDILFYNVN